MEKPSADAMLNQPSSAAAIGYSLADSVNPSRKQGFAILFSWFDSDAFPSVCNFLTDHEVLRIALSNQSSITSLARARKMFCGEPASFLRGRLGTAGLWRHMSLGEVARFHRDIGPLYVLRNTGLLSGFNGTTITLGSSSEAEQFRNSALRMMVSPGGSGSLVALVLAELKFDTKDIEKCLRIAEEPLTIHRSNAVVVPWCRSAIRLALVIDNTNEGRGDYIRLGLEILGDMPALCRSMACALPQLGTARQVEIGVVTSIGVKDIVEVSRLTHAVEKDSWIYRDLQNGAPVPFLIAIWRISDLDHLRYRKYALRI